MTDSSAPASRRRTLLKAISGAAVWGLAPAMVDAQPADARVFAPRPEGWQSFDVTTSVQLQGSGPARVWIPLPSVDTDWQRAVSNDWSGNAAATRVIADSEYGARYLMAEFDGSAPPELDVVSRVQTRSRAIDWSQRPAQRESAAALKPWTRSTALIPTDGIVRVTARQIVEGARTDVEKVQRIYDWIIVSTYREPKVRGCGTGDIKAMLESGNFGGKCGDINGLFVGLCRAAGIPARDAYGLRLAPSAFGYKELGGNPASLKGAQHCRAEVYLRRHGWVAMDPADVGKVMRQETSEWIKDLDHPVVAPVRKALFGSWEGNWMAYNYAHDLKLAGASGGKLGFFMYPQAEINGEPVDPLAPDAFKYTITSKKVDV